MAPISAGNLDSIDVVRGAGSVRYGPQNVGGVINFVTRAVPEKATGEIGTTLETSQRGGWKHIDTAFLGGTRSEEHTSELQSLMRISYAVFCLKKKKKS